METVLIKLSGHYLITPGTRKVYKILGFVILLIGIFALVLTIIENEIDIAWISTISYLLMGLYFLSIGFGFFDNIISEYIKLNDRQIIYKPYFFKKHKLIEVENIKEISIAPLAIILKTENDDLRINLRWISYVNVRKAKKAIKTLAELKNIKIIA